MKWLRWVRGALGMGLTWAVAWGSVGVLIALGFVVATGSRPDPPFPLMLGVFGFVAGVCFSGVLGLVEGRRGFEEMSIRRFAAWGSAGGLLLSGIFVSIVSLNANPGFMWQLLLACPIFAVAAGTTAAGSLALARRTRDRDLLDAPDCVAALEHPGGNA